MKKRLLLAFLSILFVPSTASASCQDIDTRLNALASDDQQVRAEWNAMERKGDAGEAEKQALQQRWRDIDRENLRQLEQIIADCGWPASTKGSHSAWLLAQHADEDVAFQRQARDVNKREASAERTGLMPGFPDCAGAGALGLGIPLSRVDDALKGR